MLLRPFVPADRDLLLRAFADPEVRRWNPGPDGDPAGVSTWLARRNDWGDASHASWAVADPADAQLLGSVSLHEVDRDQGDAQVGYWLAPWARGRGWATRAVVAATRYAFGPLGLHRVVLYHAVENVPSCRVATAAWYAHEGRLRQSYRFPDGRYHDEHLHARLVGDPPGRAAGAGEPAR